MAYQNFSDLLEFLKENFEETISVNPEDSEKTKAAQGGVSLVRTIQDDLKGKIIKPQSIYRSIARALALESINIVNEEKSYGESVAHTAKQLIAKADSMARH